MDKNQETVNRLEMFCECSDNEHACATFITSAYLRCDISLEQANEIANNRGIAGPLMFWTEPESLLEGR